MSFLRVSACAAVVAAAAFGAGPAAAQSAAWSVVLGPYAHHWRPSPEHRNAVMLGLERQRTDGSLWGASLFRNSFGQPSVYAYYGQEWTGLLGQPQLFAKLTGGVIYGYTGRYANKVPLNRGGFSPAIVPAIGWRFTAKDAVQAELLGNAGVAFTYHRRF